jgi:hypothetical protein
MGNAVRFMRLNEKQVCEQLKSGAPSIGGLHYGCLAVPLAPGSGRRRESRSAETLAESSILTLGFLFEDRILEFKLGVLVAPVAQLDRASDYESQKGDLGLLASLCM